MSTPEPSTCPDCGAPTPSGSRCERCAKGSGAGEGDSPIRYIGDYELLSLVGRGGMGVVYRARQRSLNRIVALKLLLGGAHARDSFKNRFRQEAHLAARLRHPGIAGIYETGEHEGQPFIAMEFIDGRDLASLTANGPLRPEMAARYVWSATQAIQHAHEQGVLHRDLKPANLLLGTDGAIHVTDFGLARDAHDETGLTLTGSMLGSPGYLPPEQVAMTRRSIGPASDVYSLGAVLYHLLCGRAPFVAATVAHTLELVSHSEPVSPSQLNPAVPDVLERICLKCLQKNPLRRYRTASELAEALELWLKDPRREPAGSGTGRARSMRPRIAVIAAAVLVFATLFGLKTAIVSHRAERQPVEIKPIQPPPPALNQLPQLVIGSVKQEVFHHASGPRISRFTNSWRFPAFPNQVRSLPSLETATLLPSGSGMRISGFLIPPISGAYTFFLTAQDESVLLLESGEKSRPLTPVAWDATNWDPQYNPSRAWTRAITRGSSPGARPVSNPIELQAGRRYRIELLTARLSNLPSYSGVAWRLPGGPAPGSGEPPISGSALAFENPAFPIAVQPAEIVVLEGESAWLRVGIASPDWDTVQWWRQNALLPGATNFLVRTPPQRRTDSGTVYHCMLGQSTTDRQLRSSTTVVRVTPDTQAPRLLAAGAMAGTNVVGLAFEERLDGSSISNVSNYNLGGATIREVVSCPGDRHLLLLLAQPVPQTFQAQVTGIRDWAGNAMYPARIPGSRSAFQASHHVNPDWGRRQPGLVIPLGTGDFDVLSRGRGYGGNTPPREDDMEFIFQPVSGDFEASVLISHFEKSETFAQAGLMVRESLASDAAHLNIHVNPPDGSDYSFVNYILDQPGPRAFPAATLGAGPSAVPNAWLRIQRQGNLFSFFRSTDGQQWKLIRTQERVLNREVLVGTASAAAYGRTAGGWIAYRHLTVSPK